MKIEKKIDQESQSICTLNSIEENRVLYFFSFYFQYLYDDSSVKMDLR